MIPLTKDSTFSKTVRGHSQQLVLVWGISGPSIHVLHRLSEGQVGYQTVVGVVIVLEVTESALATRDGFHLFAVHWGTTDPVAILDDGGLRWVAVGLMSALISGISQTFYAWGIYTYSKKLLAPRAYCHPSLTASTRLLSQLPYRIGLARRSRALRRHRCTDYDLLPDQGQERVSLNDSDGQENPPKSLSKADYFVLPLRRSILRSFYVDLKVLNARAKVMGGRGSYAPSEEMLLTSPRWDPPRSMSPLQPPDIIHDTLSGSPPDTAAPRMRRDVV
ncbi:hypothetical protein CC2G_002150 [Coprinopsis cinerea AmutBmut pab1-1]|nr:hypothetical protein CC2G_002150 [Coprinopsis cinerea AmutBmut pab1-1]